MKITKLMLSALVAAAALVSCNKEDLDPETIGLKTVKVSLENAIMTKGPAGDKITAGKAVKVNNIKIFFTDDNYTTEFDAHDKNGDEVSTYFDNLPTTAAVFHFISNQCTKVLVVANCDDPNISLEDVVDQENPILIESQQEQSDLILVGNNGLTRVEDDITTTDKNESVDHHGGKYTEVYQATVNLYPIISRFEVDGFAVNFQKNTFSQISVLGVGFQNYYTKSIFSKGGFVPNTSSIYSGISDLDDQLKVIEWFQNDANKNKWYMDEIENVTLMPGDNKETLDEKEKLAYHFYPGTLIPTMIIRLEGNQMHPAYVYATSYSYKDSNNQTQNLSTLQAGMIYRMNSNSGDGIVEIPDNFDPIDRCINVTVTATPWQVQLITPNFTGSN